MTSSDPAVLLRIRAFLDEASVAYDTRHHAPTHTSEEAAAARGESVRIGAKALLIKVDSAFRLFVLSAARRLHTAPLRKHFGARRSRFATKDELLELTGLVPGSVPPFGRPIFDFECFVDPSVLANERMAFNAGSLTDSIVMATADFARITGYESFPFTREG